ncbi:hypothetical protein [Capnocytophaga leadbetteri]|uniref:hypothetical protein n=1 Tax=Capnocytophaga leadbetteri TaxID=327575 RepID=UPI0028D0827A|nr:hypothetical protein [Capnocytophaga leadbetteri]
MEPKYKVNPLTGELQEYVFEYNGILALRNFTARVEDERLILHAADDVNFSILEALVSEVEINGVVYDNPTAAQEALTRLTFNQNRPVLLDKSLKDLILGAVQKVEGKGLSSNDYTNDEKQKNEENALKRVANITVTGDVNKIITITFADSTVIQAPFKDNDHIPSADVNMNSLNFNINTGVLTGVKNDGNEITVTLDGRYALISHNHDEQYAAKEHTHSEYAPIKHTHNWNDIQGKPDNLATTDNVKTAIEGIQIGGRNLLRNSKQKITKNEYAIASFLLSEEPKENEQVTFTLKGELGAGKSDFRLYNKSGYQELCILQDKGNGIYQQTFNWKKDPTNPLLVVIYVFHQNVIVNSTIEWIKLERGNSPTDWSPAPEDFDFFKGNIQLSDLNTFKNRETGGFSVNTGGGWGAYLNFKLDGSTSSLEFFKPNWYPYSRMGIRNSVDSIRFNDDNGGFRDLAWYDDILRAGVECTQNSKLQREHQNQTIFVTVPCNIELNTIDDLSSVSFRKVFDNGIVSFSCTGKNIIYTSDNQFNGKKGSTAVISRYGNDCYIDIRNV